MQYFLSKSFLRNCTIITILDNSIMFYIHNINIMINKYKYIFFAQWFHIV